MGLGNQDNVLLSFKCSKLVYPCLSSEGVSDLNHVKNMELYKFTKTNKNSVNQSEVRFAED